MMMLADHQKVVTTTSPTNGNTLVKKVVLSTGRKVGPSIQIDKVTVDENDKKLMASIDNESGEANSVAAVGAMTGEG